MINLYQKGNNGIVLLSRDKDGKRIKNEYNDFRPYMYVYDKNGEYKSLLNEKLKKIVYRIPGDVKRERDKYQKTWESDILYPLRFLIDRVSEISLAPIRKCYLDIETGDINNYDEEVLNPKKPILCLSCYDNFSDKMITFIYHPTIKIELSTTKVYNYKTEQDMLNAFIGFIIVTDPDLLVGWNSNNFDLPYIINRCIQLNIPINKIAYENKKIEIQTFVSKLTRYREIEIGINGRYCFDLKRGYRYIKTSELESHNLNDVAQLELQKGKILLDKTPEQLWNEGKLFELIDYNINDVQLCYELDKELEIVDRFNERRIEAGCRWEELWQTTKLHDVGLLRHAKEKNLILPRKEKTSKQNKIKGGYVHISLPGLHYGVCVFDFVSLYPNLIRSWNMSPETKSPNGQIFTTNGIRFKNDFVGFIPSYVTKILQLRELYKVKKNESKNNSKLFKQYDLKQYAKKIEANSLFGAFDNPGFRLFDQDISASITIMGQEANKWITYVTKELGYQPIYGDTDSLFVELGQITNDRLIEEGLSIEKYLNNSLDDFVKKFGVKKHYLTVFFDKIFSSCYFGARINEHKRIGSKKRYAGYLIWER